MEDIIKQFLEEQFPKTEIALGYIKAGKTYFKGMLKKDTGVIEIENSGSLFEIGSITKVFTSTVLAQLINEGKVNKESLISNILHHKNIKNTDITLESLANHTSGLPRLPENFYTIENHDEKNPYLNYNENAINDYLENHLTQSSEANKKFEYSNLGTGLLGYIISKIEEAPFDNVVRERVFAPLKMNVTSFDINKKENSVVGLDKNGNPSNYWQGGILSGCIGIISSVKDMVKYMSYILDKNNEASNLQLKATHKIDDHNFIGLGWGIRSLANGSTSYNHGGGSHGYSCYMKLHRESQSGIILLTNISAFKENHQTELNELVNGLRDDIIND